MKGKLTILYRSFFDGSAYYSVAKGEHTIFVVLLLCAAIVSIPSVVQTGISFSAFVKDEVYPLVEQIPDMRIQDGVLSVKNDERVVLESRTGIKIAVIDPALSIYSERRDSDQILALFKDGIISVKSTGELRIIPFNKNISFDIKSAVAERFVRKYPLVLILFSVVIVAGAYVLPLFWGAVHVVTGTILAKIAGSTISVKSLFAIAVLAHFPGAVLKTVLGLFNVPLHWLVRFIITVLYIGYALFYIKKVSQPVKNTDNGIQEGNAH